MTETVIPRRLASIAEAAAVVHRHPATVRRWIMSGALTAWRVNRTELRIDLDELAALTRPVPIRCNEVAS